MRTRSLRILAYAAPFATAISAAHAAPVTFHGSAQTNTWITRPEGVSGPQVAGAPAALEAALPPLLAVTATATYDPALATSGGLLGNQQYHYGLVTALNIQIGAHTVVRDLANPATALNYMHVWMEDNPLNTWDQVSVGYGPVLFDGSTTLAGFPLSSAGVFLSNEAGDVLSSTEVPATLCLAEWDTLNVSLVVRGEGTALHQLYAYGTPDRSIDSDGDGIIDGEERALVVTLPSLDPCDPDSDDDSVSDGDELAAGTSPVAADTDGDGLADGVDPDPLVPGLSGDALAEEVREIANDVTEIPAASFTGPNANAERGRRNALANRLQAAANHIEDGDFEEALAILEHVRELVDGDPSPPDVMDPGSDKDMVRDQIDTLIALLETLAL